MRVQSEHWRVIVEFAEENPGIITNKYNNIHGRQTLKQLWATLTINLNSLGFGEKTVEEWKKTLADWKSKTKVKACKIRQHTVTTGGGPEIKLVLTPYEERLLAIMGESAIGGDQALPEIGIQNKTLLQEKRGTVENSLENNNNTWEEFVIVMDTDDIATSSEVVATNVEQYKENNISNISDNQGDKIKRTRKQKKLKEKQKVNELKQLEDMNAQTLNVLKKIETSLETLSANFERFVLLVEKFVKE